MSRSVFDFFMFSLSCFILLLFFKAAKTGYSDDFTLDDRFVSSAANKISPAELEQRAKQRAIRGVLRQTKLPATLAYSCIRFDDLGDLT